MNLTVGRGTGVIDFSINNRGYGYGVGEVLTVDVGGITGIPTDISKSFEEFSLTIERTQTDSFNGWSLGQFTVLDSFENEFDGFKKTFRLTENGETVSIVAQRGSTINIEETLVILINNVLQNQMRHSLLRVAALLNLKKHQYLVRLHKYYSTKEVVAILMLSLEMLLIL